MRKEKRKSTKEYLYSVGDIVITKTGKIKILECIKLKQGVRDTKGYSYECMIDGYKGTMDESRMFHGGGCGVCYGNKVIKGYNDIATTNPLLAKYFKNIEDTYKYKVSSNVKVFTICPDCGFEREYKISQLKTYGYLPCPKCGDKVSYGERIMFNVLTQLGVIFNYHVRPIWAKNTISENKHLCGTKEYDFVVDNNEIYIEVHGLQHYKKTSYNTMKSNRYVKTFEEEQENDKIKEELAIKNGVKHYIVIDCKISDLEWIKNSILNSELNCIFDLNIIDWNKCNEYACSSCIKEACDYWNSGVKSTFEIADKMNIVSATVSNYLKRGYELGFCDYTTKLSQQINGMKFGKEVIILENGMVFKSTNNLAEVSEKVLGTKLYCSSICKVCNSKQLQHKGFHFKYTKDLTPEELIKYKIINEAS